MRLGGDKAGERLWQSVLAVAAPWGRRTSFMGSTMADAAVAGVVQLHIGEPAAERAVRAVARDQRCVPRGMARIYAL